MNFFVVGIGGALGAMCRYFLGTVIPKAASGFPVPTFVVNVVGCFLLGAIAAIVARHGLANSHVALLLQTGVCGGFTTFSTFSQESFKLLSGNTPGLGLAYMIASVVLGVLAIGTGSFIAGHLS